MHLVLKAIKPFLQLAIWAGSAALQLLVLALLITSLLVGTDFGTRLAFNVAAKFVDLKYQTLSGNLFHNLEINELTLQSDGIDLKVSDIHWQLDMSTLWNNPEQRQLTLRLLQINGIRLAINPGNAPAKETGPNSQPSPLADIQLPFAFTAERIVLSDIHIQQGDQTWQLEQLSSQLHIARDASSKLQLSVTNGPYQSNAELTLTTAINKQAAQAELLVNSAQAQLNQHKIHSQGKVQVAWDGKMPTLSADQFVIHVGSAKIQLNGDQQALSLTANVPDLSIATPELSGQLQADLTLKNAKQNDLSLTLKNVSWLNQPMLSAGQLNSKGSLAEQHLTASLTVNALGATPVVVDSRFGWRDSIDALIAASSLPPEKLLKSPTLHFTSTIALPNAEIVATGMQARDNQLALLLTPQGGLELSGHSKSGNGQLELLGNLIIKEAASADIELQASVDGKQYQLANTPELKLVTSPKIQTTLAEQTLTVRGEVIVDSGHIELIVPEESAITPSADVIIIDDTTNNTPATIINRDILITLKMANPISLEGQGFKGSATGQLKVKENNGQVPTGSGELVLAGQYQAYGQDLTIRRGKLIYVDSPLDDPGLDLEAIRTVNQQIAGVRVSGLASNPSIEIFAEPALSETEALSYLVLGRGLDGNSEEDANRLRNLAISLGLAGSGKVLKKYKDKIGVDELSLQAGDSTNQANLLVGRQLSEKLYLSTQIGLFEPVTKFYLRYTLSRRCYFLSETGQQQAADVVCTFKQR